MLSKTKGRSRKSDEVLSSSNHNIVSTKLWFMHSGNVEETDPPYHKLDKFRTTKALEEVRAELGEHHITHLCVEGDIPLALRNCAPLLTELKLRDVSNATIVLSLLKESFKFLTKLDLSGNDFSKGLFETVSEWFTLEELDVSHCQLRTLPNSLRSLKMLKILNASHNDFSDGLPTCVTELNSLKELNVNKCYLQELPVRLRSLKMLKILNASHNDFSDGLPTCVTELNSLKELNVNKCYLQELPVQLQSLAKLEKLRVSYNTFTDGQFPLLVCELTSLRELEMESCGLTNLPRSLRVLSQIENLDLSDNEFSNRLPECISQLTSLKILRIGNCRLQELPDSFVNLKLLEILNIRMNLFQSLPAVICKLTKLRVLVMGCLTSTNETLEKLDSCLLKMEKLAVINCQGCEALTSPPYAVCQQGAAAIKKYYRDLDKEKGQELPVIMVAVIGNSMSGKTSLIRSLQNNKRELTYRKVNCALDETTEVFQMNRLILRENHLRFIDFGGHEVYHMAYQMAMKDNCIPLIVVNMEEYAKLCVLTNPMEACRKVCFDWMSHFYLACPRLGHPILVLTHKDKLSDEKFNLLATELIESTEAHRQELLEEEKELFGDSSDFCHILHLSDLNESVFCADHVFSFGDDPDELQNIEALKVSLENYCQKFNITIPRAWELMGNYLDDRLDQPFLQLSDIQKEFPGEEQLVILRYMHNIGRVLWYEHEVNLKPYVFHQIQAITDMVSLLFHHTGTAAWEQRVAKFRPFRYRQKVVEKEKYEELVSTFTTVGIMDEAMLFNLFTTESVFPADVALAVLQAFHLLHGPVLHGARNAYIVPYFSTKHKDQSYISDGCFQVKVDILFKGLALPKYVHQLLTVAVLNMHKGPWDNSKYAARNGATIQHGNSTTHLVHNSSERKVTVQVSASVDELSLSWQYLIRTCLLILDYTNSLWKATRPVVICYCAHCLFMRDSSPGHRVDPEWLSNTILSSGFSVFTGITVVKCCKDKTSRTSPTIPMALTSPCVPIPEHLIPMFQKRLKELEKSRFPPYNFAVEDEERDVAGSATNSAQSLSATASVAAVSVSEADSDLSDGLEYLEDTNDYMDIISLRLIPCRKTRIRDLFTSDKVYSMSGLVRGRCLIINNLNFDTPASGDQIALGTRDGSQMDVKNISRVWKALSFVEGIHTDLTSQEMIDAIQTETQHASHARYGMFVLVIMSHGTENQIYGKDGRAVNLSSIYDCLSAYRFPAMAGKPKVIIIQACSGKRLDSMGSVMYDSPTPIAMPKGAVSLPPLAADGVVEKPLPGEFLSTDDLYIMKASFLSYVSSRHGRNGSWFIRALVEALYKHACHRDLQSLFQQVKKKVRKRSQLNYIRTLDGSGQQPTDECTFRDSKKLYLFPDYNP